MLCLDSCAAIHAAPIYPGTWFAVQMFDGVVIKCRSSAFHRADRPDHLTEPPKHLKKPKPQHALTRDGGDANNRALFPMSDGSEGTRVTGKKRGRTKKKRKEEVRLRAIKYIKKTKCFKKKNNNK